jgi:hypothetical protein
MNVAPELYNYFSSTNIFLVLPLFDSNSLMLATSCKSIKVDKNLVLVVLEKVFGGLARFLVM